MCYYGFTPTKEGEKMSTKEELKDRLRKALELREKKAIDLSRDLNIPKSAISQYLSGYRTIKDSRRLYAIAEYLDVEEAWLMGFDVPMDRRLADIEEKPVETANKLANLFKRIEFDEDEDFDLFSMLEEYNGLPKQKKAQVREYVHLLSGKD